MLKAKTVVAMAGFLAFAVAITRAAQPTPQSWGDAVNGLQTSISQDQNAKGQEKEMRLTIEFRNAGRNNITIVPGLIYTCSQIDAYTSETSYVALNLADSQGTSHALHFGDFPPFNPGCGGAADSPLVVPLPSGASFSISLDLGRYVDLSGSSQRYPTFSWRKYQVGTYFLQAQLTNPRSELSFPSSFLKSPLYFDAWKGTVNSNRLEVRFDAEFAVPLE